LPIIASTIAITCVPADLQAIMRFNIQPCRTCKRIIGSDHQTAEGLSWMIFRNFDGRHWFGD
jgi:hypothetical protein